MQIDVTGRLELGEFTVVEGKAYFSTVESNCLCEYNIGNGQVKSLGEIPHQHEKGRNQYGVIICSQEKLYIAPNRGKDIIVYDLEKKEFHILEIKYGQRGSSDSNMKFMGAFFYEGWVVFVPGSYKAIVMVNVENEQISYMDCLYQYTNEKYVVPRNGFMEKNGILYCCLWGKCEVAEINLKTQKTIIHHITSENMSGWWHLVIYEEGYLWLMNAVNGDIGRYNLKSKQLQIFSAGNDDMYHVDGEYISSFNIKDKIIAFAYHGKSSCIFRKINGDRQLFDERDQEKFNVLSGYECVKMLQNESFLMFGGKGKFFFIYDSIRDKKSSLPMYMLYADYKQVKLRKEEEAFHIESELFSLDIFLQAIVETENG